ncbi:MAG: hypothetical protein PHH26_01940 [Candidatus Thermoplasmatota archaeon]|nr:hypothetical protein [Candidatus Thermoplasmatota archaeon]
MTCHPNHEGIISPQVRWKGDGIAGRVPPEDAAASSLPVPDNARRIIKSGKTTHYDGDCLVWEE